ncbi:MAG TPA: MW1434 family type I TA system toxin [Clostridia bacterium]|nr:MW1434 family type I TA system toxin [Clostridia bacterium]
MDFPDALKKCIYDGKRITNENWNGKGMLVYSMDQKTIQCPDSKEKQMVLLPYLMLRDVNGDFSPWTISHLDVYSTKWKVIE